MVNKENLEEGSLSSKKEIAHKVEKNLKRRLIFTVWAGPKEIHGYA